MGVLTELFSESVRNRKGVADILLPVHVPLPSPEVIEEKPLAPEDVSP